MIITDSHVIARSQTKTYAISEQTKQVVWQWPVSGYMALSDDRLYIADSSGLLTAISAPMGGATTPPVGDAGEDQEVDAGVNCTATVTLDGSASSDAEGDELAYRWYYEGLLFGESVEIEAELGLGEHVFGLIVNDGVYDSEPNEVRVAVVDHTGPAVVVRPMVEIWPPNHKYHELSLSDLVGSVDDNCDGLMDVDSVGRIISIHSDEPEDGGGDGNTTEDAVILGNSRFKVRAERLGNGDGRVYGVTFEVGDEAGNITQETGYVGVPHDSGAPSSKSQRARRVSGPRGR